MDLGVLPHLPCHGPMPPAALLPPHLEAQVYDEYYGAALGPKLPTRPSPLVQHRLAKLVFKGENGERLDDFVYQVEKFAAFHTWDLVETCRQARTHFRGVALANICRTPLPPRNWPELKDSLVQQFQPRYLTTAYKAQFHVRRRHQGEDICTYVNVLQKLAEMAWPLLDLTAREEMITDQFLTSLDSHEL